MQLFSPVNEMCGRNNWKELITTRKKIIKSLALILQLGHNPNFLFKKVGLNVDYLPFHCFSL
jgi:hypothetical protein